MKALSMFCLLLLCGLSGALVQAAPGATPSIRDGVVDLNRPQAVKQALHEQLSEWYRVPNRVGGLSKSGVDCSGFAYLTYREYFGIKLPRTTRQQAQVGVGIGMADLKPGDLVFFRTGIYQRHVGMYTGKGRFIHASTSRGVMESRLDNPYWRRNYWKAVRVRL
jgi:probable lipoprotein NlpC